MAAGLSESMPAGSPDIAGPAQRLGSVAQQISPVAQPTLDEIILPLVEKLRSKGSGHAQ